MLELFWQIEYLIAFYNFMLFIRLRVSVNFPLNRKTLVQQTQWLESKNIFYWSRFYYRGILIAEFEVGF